MTVLLEKESLAVTSLSPALHRLSPKTWAWVHERTGWGWSNCGLVVSEGAALLVDTQFTLDATRELIDAIARAFPGVPVGTIVNTHQNGDHTWGNQLFPAAEVVTSAASAEHLCLEMGPEQLSVLSRSGEKSSVPAYVSKHFGCFDFAGIEVAGPSRTFSGREEVKVGSVAVELIDLGPGHSAGDVAVHVLEEGVVFAGDALFAGMHMVVWSGSLKACVRACDTILDTGAGVFVPGHGPVLDRAGVTAIRDQLVRVGESASGYAAAGVPVMEAARRVFAEHAGDLLHPERLFTATAAAYRDAGVAEAPVGTMALVEGMAALAG
ncbi:MBL fold metallo-hydrolase [Streptomyces sp. NPDC049555]|uniref:MBL fold metallo-hydrolase n=1 Tax=Streptomyces sp. NPDC049555 TaxID=3154930 RepID=UPI003445F73D